MHFQEVNLWRRAGSVPAHLSLSVEAANAIPSSTLAISVISVMVRSKTGGNDAAEEGAAEASGAQA